MGAERRRSRQQPERTGGPLCLFIAFLASLADLGARSGFSSCSLCLGLPLEWRRLDFPQLVRYAAKADSRQAL
jgi:hypothetical protein